MQDSKLNCNNQHFSGSMENRTIELGLPQAVHTMSITPYFSLKLSLPTLIKVFWIWSPAFSRIEHRKLNFLAFFDQLLPALRVYPKGPNSHPFLTSLSTALSKLSLTKSGNASVSANMQITTLSTKPLPLQKLATCNKFSIACNNGQSEQDITKWLQDQRELDHLQRHWKDSQV